MDYTIKERLLRVAASFVLSILILLVLILLPLKLSAGDNHPETETLPELTVKNDSITP